MSDVLAQFHFLRPWWLLGLLALPWLWRALGRSRGAARAWAKAVDTHLLPHLLVGAERSVRAPRLLVLAAGSLAVLALAGPAWERLPAPLYRNQSARVIALELSPSMFAADVKPDRVSRARYKIRDLLQRLGDGQVALLAYAGDAFVVAPLTEDANTVDALLDALDPTTMPVNGNATTLVIERAVKLIQQAGEGRGQILLVADSASSDAAAAAAAARAQGVTVSVLGVGTAQGAPVSLPGGGFLKDKAGNIVVPKLDASALAGVASAGGGRYAELSADSRDLDMLLGAAPAAQARLDDAAQARTQAWRDRGPWLALALLPLAALGFRRGWLIAVALAMTLPSAPAQAFQWRDLWQRPDQQAWQALQAQQPKDAAQTARDPALRGAAHYRDGDYAAAAQDYARGRGADADYNRGNALAKAGDYEAALGAYDAALAKDPSHADARANREAVEQWLKRQQQQRDKDSQKQKGDKGNSGKQDRSAGDGSSSQDQDKAQQDSSQSQSGDGQKNAQGKDGQDKASSSQAGESQAQDHAGHEAQAKESQNGQGQGDDAKAQAQREAAQREAMQRALQQAQQGKQGEAGKEQREGVAASAAAQPETEAQRQQRQAMEQWLQRVPDDPGGLLRRKFQLEYERRQNNGGKDR